MDYLRLIFFHFVEWRSRYDNGKYGKLVRYEWRFLRWICIHCRTSKTFRIRYGIRKTYLILNFKKVFFFFFGHHTRRIIITHFRLLFFGFTSSVSGRCRVCWLGPYRKRTGRASDQIGESLQTFAFGTEDECNFSQIFQNGMWRMQPHKAFGVTRWWWWQLSRPFEHFKQNSVESKLKSKI